MIKTMRVGYKIRIKKIKAKSGRSLIVEEIYYITINPIRIENYITVLPMHTLPFLII
jgi:hypothetical protein